MGGEMMIAPEGGHKSGSYISFILRLWREAGEGNLWRASLESTETPGRIGFPSLKALFEYLLHTTVGHENESGKEDKKEEIPKS
jgi:hypothetical protein